MCSGAGHTTWLVRGSPIRTSSDQRSVDSSPRLIAASYVLHRLLVPRHPPCALNNLATQKTAHPPPEGNDLCGPTQTPATESEDARVHCAVLNVRPVPDPTPPPAHPPPRGQRRYDSRSAPKRSSSSPPGSPGGSAPSGPNSVPTTPDTGRSVSSRPRRHAVLRTGRRRRPNWSAFHPRAPSRTPAAPRNRAAVTIRARLCTTRGDSGGQCSLERR